MIDDEREGRVREVLRGLVARDLPPADAADEARRKRALEAAQAVIDEALYFLALYTPLPEDLSRLPRNARVALKVYAVLLRTGNLEELDHWLQMNLAALECGVPPTSHPEWGSVTDADDRNTLALTLSKLPPEALRELRGFLDALEATPDIVSLRRYRRTPLRRPPPPRGQVLPLPPRLLRDEGSEDSEPPSDREP